jgi:serine/threonine-protein kinase HipA
MKKALIKIHNIDAGIFSQHDDGSFQFDYLSDYSGPEISLTMPRSQQSYLFDSFPPFFDGLLPEGNQLEGVLKFNKIDRLDYFSQLIAVGQDLVGAVTVSAIHE